MSHAEDDAALHALRDEEQQLFGRSMELMDESIRLWKAAACLLEGQKLDRTRYMEAHRAYMQVHEEHMRVHTAFMEVHAEILRRSQ